MKVHTTILPRLQKLTSAESLRAIAAGFREKKANPAFGKLITQYSENNDKKGYSDTTDIESATADLESPIKAHSTPVELFRILGSLSSSQTEVIKNEYKNGVHKSAAAANTGYVPPKTSLNYALRENLYELSNFYFVSVEGIHTDRFA